MPSDFVQYQRVFCNQERKVYLYQNRDLKSLLEVIVGREVHATSCIPFFRTDES